MSASGQSSSAADTGPAALLIIWHSRTGAGRQLAQAAHDGARQAEPPDASRLLPCDQAQPQDLLDARTYLFVCPENLGSMSGLMKEFFDRCYYPLFDRIVGRGYASVVCAGSDGQGAQRQIARITTGWRLRCVSEPVIVLTDAQTEQEILAPKQVGADDLSMARDLGAALVSGAVLGIY